MQLILGSLLTLCASALASEKPESVLALEKASNDSLLWGPYRPNVYFGVRPRIPKSLTTGLLWANVDSPENAQSGLRYTCEQNAGMAGYGWDEYDIRTGGRQTIQDTQNGMDITTEFVKIQGGNHGGNWAVRVKGVPKTGARPDLHTAVWVYTTLEGDGQISVENAPNTLGYTGPIDIKGNTPELGDFKIQVTTGPSSNQHPPNVPGTAETEAMDHTLVTSLNIPPEAAWQAKGILLTTINSFVGKMIEKFGQDKLPSVWQTYSLSNNVTSAAANFYFVQKNFRGAFEFDILYNSASAPEEATSKSLTAAISSNQKDFNQRFETVFKPKAPFDKPEYSTFSKAMFSNLFGGIGYFYGEQIVDTSYAPEYEEEQERFWEDAAAARAKMQVQLSQPTELFTAIPSRPFFPRGFLWDEGFHLIPISEWDMDVTLGILKSWFDQVDADGWIAREQILGLEARSKVPRDFQIQYPHYANPPTLFLILEGLAAKIKQGVESSKAKDTLRNSQLIDPAAGLAFLKDIYPNVKKHYEWFRRTQSGDLKSYDRKASSREGYRWRGRTVEHILPSGLDDYPRAQPPHPGELHVDLISWVGLAARSMHRIAGAIGESDDEDLYARQESAIMQNIDDLHWSEADQTYCDATIDDYEEHVLVCHKGYISLFPFMTGAVGPESPRLKAVLDLISDPEELWSDFGIRSLSAKDKFYDSGENYWRSPIWINMNYLILKNLRIIATSNGPHREQARELYSLLRTNLVENIYDQWKKTGFAWEQYNPSTGAGQRTQHFTGWTSLVVNIMAMEDIPRGASQHDEL